MDVTAAVVRSALNGTSLVSKRLAGKGALRLFRLPRGRSRIRTGERTVMARALVRTIDAGGRPVMVYQWGDGRRPVLLVHGWESRGSRLSAFVDALLDRGYSPLAFDAPGHGDSEGSTTTVLEFRDILAELHAEYGDFEAVIAHSLGVVGVFLALRGSVRAGRIATIGGVADFGLVVDAFCAALRLRAPLERELRRRIEREMFPGEADIWARFSVVHRPEEVALPILVVHDEDDDTVSPDQGRQIVAAYGDRARLVSTRGLGHRRILVAPAVVAEVLDFVTARTAGEAGGEQHGEPDGLAAEVAMR